jgi:hypothetical protein
MAQMDVQVDIHTVAMGGPAEDTRVVSNGGLGMCPGCDGVLGCNADCPGGVDADAERDARIEEREAEDRAEFEWQMFLATNPELVKPSGCECEEVKLNDGSNTGYFVYCDKCRSEDDDEERRRWHYEEDDN